MRLFSVRYNRHKGERVAESIDKNYGSISAGAQYENDAARKKNSNPIDLTDAAGRRSRGEQRRQIKIKKWTPHQSGALIGFCSVQLPSGMIVHDLRLMTGKNGHWIALPAMKQVDRDGRPRTDSNGKAIYSPIHKRH
jgi:DNA-binding cell septation regulator SpoVG